MVHILKTFLESGRLLSGMSTVWEDTDGCANQYSCALFIYLMTVLSSSNVIIMDCVMNARCHVNNVVDVLNATDEHFFWNLWVH